MHPKDTFPIFEYDARLNAIDRIKHAFSQLPSHIKHLYIAFSGGLDSYVLLHLTHQLFFNYSITAIHINHGLTTESLAWEKAVQSICEHLTVPCVVYRVHDTIRHYRNAGQSPEESARKARYEALTQTLSYEDCLLTGHHVEDQAETLLLNLIRGAGVQGLGSMPLLSLRHFTFHFRPLLTWTYKERLAYAKQYNLHWIEDPSNHDQRFLRNFVRHTVLPILQKRCATPALQLTRTAAHCLKASQLSEEIAVQDLSLAETSSHQLSIPHLLSLSSLRRSNALRYWLKRHIGKPVSTAQFMRIEQLLYKLSKTNPCFVLNTTTIQRYRDHLYLLSANLQVAKSNKIHRDILWQDPQKPLKLSSYTLTSRLCQGKGIKVSLLKTGPLTIRYRQGGERFYPNNRIGSHPLKKLFQEWRILPWERDRWPLIYHNNTLIVVPGYAVSKESAAKPDETGLVIHISDSSRLNG